MSAILICVACYVIPSVAYAVTRHFWCTKHWKRQEYVSIVSHDGREYRWCSACKEECPWADRTWRRLRADGSAVSQ